MSMDSALAISSTGTAPSPAKGITATMPGAEAFAEVMAGIAATPEQQIDGVGTGANLRFNVAPAQITPEGVAHEGVAPIEPAVPGMAPGTESGIHPALKTPARPATKASSLIDPALAGTTIKAVPESDLPGLKPADDKQGVRRKRDTDDSSPETVAATPAGSPVIVPINAAPVAATPEPTTKPSAMKTRGTVSATGEAAKPTANVSSIVSILADQAGTAGERSAPTKTLPTTNSRKGAEPIPASLTAVADIVQNLPPLIQSQVGGVVPGPAAAVGPATDVGATLSGEVIDMGIGGQWIDRVAREITALAQGSGHSRFQLNPPNLGRLQIDVWQGEGGGRVQLLTETDEAAMRLRQDQAGLQADARLSALSLDRIVIDRAPGGFGPSQDQSSQAGAGRHQSSGGDSTDRSASQAGQQPAAQHGNNSGSTAGQGKAPQRRDVFNDHTQPDGQDGRASAQSDGRHVRYA